MAVKTKPTLIDCPLGDHQVYLYNGVIAPHLDNSGRRCEASDRAAATAPRKTSGTDKLTIEVTEEVLGMLGVLATMGIYGTSAAAVAERFICRQLEAFVERKMFTLPF